MQHPAENCGPSRRILEHLDLYLGKKQWDVIQLNCGIHDLTYLNEAKKVTGPKAGGKPQVPLDEYRANLETIVARLKKTGAQLIWCSTTPMNHPDVYRLPDDVDRYNEVAKEVMEKNGVRINDLNRRVHDFKKPMWTPEGVHYTPEGYRELAKAAAPVIEAALPSAAEVVRCSVRFICRMFSCGVWSRVEYRIYNAVSAGAFVGDSVQPWGLNRCARNGGKL